MEEEKIPDFWLFYCKHCKKHIISDMPFILCTVTQQILEGEKELFIEKLGLEKIKKKYGHLEHRLFFSKNKKLFGEDEKLVEALYSWAEGCPNEKDIQILLQHRLLKDPCEDIEVATMGERLSDAAHNNPFYKRVKELLEKKIRERG